MIVLGIETSCDETAAAVVTDSKKIISNIHGINYNDIDCVAVTAGPGLIGGLMVGLMVAKGIASASGKPIIGVNHLEGHALVVRLTNDIDFPYLLLLASGGHCQTLIVNGVGDYEKIGETIDDSAGEAFDKVAKMLGIGYPGGPVIEKLSQ
uniref:Gcp-like domain-containing protein n=1 Tax=Biomphalaria glabrata TaxID=6526 RepID=A0A2C9KVM2_BIOGL